MFGIRIRLNPFFLILLVFLAIFGRFLEAVILFGTVFFHEWAHAAVAKKSGLTVTEIELLPFGGVAKIDDLIELSPPVEIRVAVAGPLANAIVVGFIVLLGGSDLRHGLMDGTAAMADEGIYMLLKANVWIGSFNLIPALPLDGGRVFRALFARTIGFRRATAAAVKTGKVISVMMAVGGVLWIILGEGNITWIVVAFFLFLTARREERAAMYVLLAHLARKRIDWRGGRCLPIRHLAVAEGTQVKEVIDHIVPARFHLVWIIDERGLMSKMVTEGELIEAVFERGMDASVSELGRPF